jgi:hypothetical protein
MNRPELLPQICDQLGKLASAKLARDEPQVGTRASYGNAHW